MSSIFSDLVADALEAHCARATTSEKYLIGTVLGTSPAELYGALAARATTDVQIGEGDAAETLRGARARYAGSAHPLPRHRSDRAELGLKPRKPVLHGQASRLLRQGNDGSTPRVLVTFDDDPIETETPPWTLRLAATVLSAERCSAHSLARSDHANPAVRTLLDHIIRFVRTSAT